MASGSELTQFIYAIAAARFSFGHAEVMASMLPPMVAVFRSAEESPYAGGSSTVILPSSEGMLLAISAPRQQPSIHVA